MKQSLFFKVLAIAGWVMWPAALMVFFVSYRFTSQLSMETWARYAGQLQAKVWFQGGINRLLELSPDEKSQFTGRKEGNLEIWTWKNTTNSNWMLPDSVDEQFVEAINRRMRELTKTKQNGEK